MTFTVFQDQTGKYRWQLTDDAGKLIKFTPGSLPGHRNRKSYAAAGRNVQAALKQIAEQQALDAAQA